MCTCSITKGKNLPLKGTRRRGSITHSSEGEGSLNPRTFPWVASQSQGTVPGCRATAHPEGWLGLALRRVRFCPSQVWAASFHRAEGERVTKAGQGPETKGSDSFWLWSPHLHPVFGKALSLSGRGHLVCRRPVSESCYFRPAALNSKPNWDRNLKNTVNHLRIYFQKAFKNGVAMLVSAYTFLFPLSWPGLCDKHIQG